MRELTFVLAPDSFKESMTAKQVCQAMERGIKRVFPNANCIHVPMADGGEGTLQSLVDATNGEMINQIVTGPLGTPVTAKLGLLGDKKTAVIEMAEAAGLHLVPREKRNPLMTTTYGVGELIKTALDLNVEKIIVGLGGSATNDAGAGMLQALGVKLLDANNNELSFGGGELARLATIDMHAVDSRLAHVQFEVACDVENPLTGTLGASHIFGPQKGATPEMVEELDANLKHFAGLTKEVLGHDIDAVSGAGAAGGLGGALVGYCHATLVKGIELVVNQCNLEQYIEHADVVFTGEGSIDHQTQFGKTPVGVSMVAKKHGVKTFAVAGRVGSDIEALYDLGITGVFGILPGILSLDEALATGEENVERTVANICRVLK